MAPWDVLAKSGLLARREKLPTVSLLFVLQRKGYKDLGGKFRLGVGKRTTQQLRLRQVPLWKQKPRPRWWEDAPGLMALYPLCDHGKKPSEAVAHAVECIEGKETDTVQRAEFLAGLAFFGELAYPKLDVVSIIGRERMKESKFYREVPPRKVARKAGSKAGSKPIAPLFSEFCGDGSRMIRSRSSPQSST